MKRIALIIQYNGTSFSGWQRQKKVNTIQETLEISLFQLTSNQIKTFAAGRTDAGVHASGQVVHFDTDSPIPPYRWADALNGRLPKSIRVLESAEVPENWHACHSAIYRHYRYVINNNKIPSIFLDEWSWHRYQNLLDEELMQNALKGLTGEHDFFAFQKSGSKRSTSVTTINDIQIYRYGDILYIDVKASGFLYGMVRALVGQLVLVGENKISSDKFFDRWINKRKTEVCESAPARGLCFVNAAYRENFFKKIKRNDLFPKFVLKGFS